jgi:hypothetical protein
MNILSKGLVQDIDQAKMDKCHMWISLGFTHFIQDFGSVKLQNKSCSIEHFKKYIFPVTEPLIRSVVSRFDI